MLRSRQVGLADDDPLPRNAVERILTGLGHSISFVARSGEELVECCERHKPELVITEVAMPGLDGIEAADRIWHRCFTPVILISAYHGQANLDRAGSDPIFGYLLKPVQEAELDCAIHVAMARFKDFDVLTRESKELRQALADRKVIERAKGILMQRTGLSEPDAYRRLQKLSWDRNRKLVDIARLIVEGFELMSVG